jgi:hypothetical protein
MSSKTLDFDLRYMTNDQVNLSKLAQNVAKIVAQLLQYICRRKFLATSAM